MTQVFIRFFPDGWGERVFFFLIFIAIFTGIRLILPGIYNRVKAGFEHQMEALSLQLGVDFIKLSPQRLSKWFYGYYGFWFLTAFALCLPYYIVGILAGSIFVFIASKIPLKVADVYHQRRVSKFGMQMVDSLTLMANGLRSGLNISQTIDLVSQEMPNPISQEFGLILSETQLGTTIEAAFENLSNRMPLEDVEMLATAIVILKETGGNLAETFDTITHTIRERIKIKNKISAMVTQGIVQGAIIMAMPFGLAIMLYMIDPNQILPMFTTPIGWVMLGMILVLQVLGGLAIWKIIDIKV